MSSPPPSFSHPGPAPLHPELPDGIERTPGPSEPPRGLAAVPIWAPFAAMFAVFLVAGFVAALIGGVVSATGTEVSAEDTPPGVLISAAVVQFAATVAFAILFARNWAGPVRAATFGVRRTPWLRALGWTALTYLAFGICALIYSAIVGPGPQQDLVDDLKDERSLVVLVGFALMVGVLAPIAEELFFRGFLFGVLRERIGAGWGAAIAGTVFGLVHVAGTPVRTLGILVVLGVGLCLLYQKTGSLLPGMALHAVNNAVALGATKELRWWLFILVVLGSAALVLAAMTAVVAREQRTA
ncbi:MAG: CPBP family intramembrane metalloprotease [Actinomycetota bacterium]|nr:CPBP family intramembrane metalloprotease [Actinomycetota bacterium]